MVAAEQDIVRGPFRPTSSIRSFRMLKMTCATELEKRKHRTKLEQVQRKSHSVQCRRSHEQHEPQTFQEGDDKCSSWLGCDYFGLLLLPLLHDIGEPLSLLTRNLQARIKPRSQSKQGHFQELCYAHPLPFGSSFSPPTVLLHNDHSIHTMSEALPASLRGDSKRDLNTMQLAPAMLRSRSCRVLYKAMKQLLSTEDECGRIQLNAKAAQVQDGMPGYADRCNLVPASRRAAWHAGKGTQNHEAAG
eukprot:1983278-Amphidinium_carterae.1